MKKYLIFALLATVLFTSCAMDKMNGPEQQADAQTSDAVGRTNIAVTTVLPDDAQESALFVAGGKKWFAGDSISFQAGSVLSGVILADGFTPFPFVIKDPGDYLFPLRPIDIPQDTTEVDSSMGMILIDSMPAGADVYVNGTFIGITPDSGQIVLHASLGEHQIHMELAEYYPHDQIISLVKAGDIGYATPWLIPIETTPDDSTDTDPDPEPSDRFFLVNYDQVSNWAWFGGTVFEECEDDTVELNGSDGPTTKIAVDNLVKVDSLYGVDLNPYPNQYTRLTFIYGQTWHYHTYVLVNVSPSDFQLTNVRMEEPDNDQWFTLIGTPEDGPEPPTNQAPVAIATVTPLTGEAPLTVYFDASGSYDPDGDSIGFFWRTGLQNQDSFDPTFTRTYSEPGVYPVQLAVIDHKGGVDTLSLGPIVVTEPAQPTQYMLDISATNGGTTTPAIGTYTHQSGSVVSVTANPAAGWVFSHWIGNVADNSGSSTTVTMDDNQSVTAVFEMIPEPPADPYLVVSQSNNVILFSGTEASKITHIKLWVPAEEQGPGNWWTAEWLPVSNGSVDISGMGARNVMTIYVAQNDGMAWSGKWDDVEVISPVQKFYYSTDGTNNFRIRVAQ